MRALYRAFTLCALLIAVPAIAQQGPAGVPGAPGLAPPPPPPPVVMAAPEVPSKAVEASAPTCAKNKSCRPKKKAKAANTCSTASDPVRCEQYRRTRELCKNVADYRQCLRDNLSTR